MASNRDERGRFLPRVSGNPSGRPKAADDLRRRLESGVGDAAEAVLKAAKEGDLNACRIIIERTLPALRPHHAAVRFEIDPAAPLADQGRAIVAAVADGQLPPDQGKALLDGIASLARITEIDELAARIAKLESMTDEGP
ncbi:hypothetical protein [Marinobacter fonticola]|uniref:hypothetical protein n=1 Tax=Marinobacter fonticola TaxID=2603215 RepID=UPI0011E846FB|nr:hypothetical protein [Marinobacter fonticola]